MVITIQQLFIFFQVVLMEVIVVIFFFYFFSFSTVRANYHPKHESHRNFRLYHQMLNIYGCLPTYRNVLIVLLGPFKGMDHYCLNAFASKT
jgi:hypothetical protein